MNDLIPTEQQFNVINYMAKQASASKFYQSLGGEAGIMSIMLLARELNIPLFQALSGGIWNIQGKVEMSARMMNMKIRQAGHKLTVKKWDTSGCTIEGIRSDTGETLEISFNHEDAKRANLSDKNVWKLYPREMYFNRSLSILARMLFPDVIGNCYIEGEIKDALEENESPKEKIQRAPQKNNTPVSYEPIKEESVEDAIVESSIPESAMDLDASISLEQFEELIALIGEDAILQEKILSTFNIEHLSALRVKDFPITIKRVKASKK